MAGTAGPLACIFFRCRIALHQSAHSPPQENLGVYDFSLSPEEVKQVDELSSDPIAEDFIFFKL